MHRLRLIFCLLFIVAAATESLAREQFSYLYIQGDKKTPFYVKLEDAMQPRYGKNYCILPRLAPGPVHLEILFQQNAFPSQQFTVLVPESGSRGFLLVQKDSSFSLYDLQQGFSLAAGNTEADDKLPEATLPAFATATAPVKPAEEKEPVRTAPPVEVPLKTPVAEKTPAVKSSDNKPNEPAFIADIELSGKPQTTDNQPAGDKTIAAAGPAITNSDCPSAVSAAEFSPIFSSMSAKGGDEARLAFIMEKMNVCYESWQARSMAQILTGEAARFTLLKLIYPHITDQASFSLLDDLFASETWKAEFNELVHSNK